MKKRIKSPEPLPNEKEELAGPRDTGVDTNVCEKCTCPLYDKPLDTCRTKGCGKYARRISGCVIPKECPNRAIMLLTSKVYSNCEKCLGDK